MTDQYLIEAGVDFYLLEDGSADYDNYGNRSNTMTVNSLYIIMEYM